MAIHYKAFRSKNGAGNWDVGIEKVDTKRPDPDPWGNGPIILVYVCKNILPDRDFDTPGLATTFRKSGKPPACTDSALNKANRLAMQLNEGVVDEKRLREINRGINRGY